MTEPQAPYMQPSGPPEPRTRHRVRNIALATVGILVVIIVAVGIAGGSKHSAAPASHPKAATPAATTAPRPAAALSAGQQKFVSAIRSALAAGGYSSSATDAQLAHVGTEICTLRAAGGSQADVTGVISGAEAKFSMTPGKLVRTAERAMCPAQYPQPPVVLLSMSGSGIENSAPVLVTTGTLTVTYSYNCSAFGTSGNFIADFETVNQGSLSSDDQSIANALGDGGSATTTIYPQDVGSDYHLAVTSECSWTVVVTTAP